MRIAAFLVLSLGALVVRAETTAPVGKAAGKPLATIEPPEGRFFDEPFAVAPDGKRVAAVATDAASVSGLYVWSADGTAMVGGVPLGVVSVGFVSPDRVLVVGRSDGGEQVVGYLATIKDTKAPDGKTRPAVSLDKVRLGPATAIDLIGPSNKRLITVYKLAAKKTPEHNVQVLDAVTLRPVARRTLVETSEGLLNTRAGEVRALWWANGHTRIGGLKIGEYDKARDVRRPNRFIGLDLVADKVSEEREIEDVMGFAKMTALRKSGPAAESYAHLSDDRQALFVVDGIDERSLPLTHDVSQYDPASLRWQAIDDKTLLVGMQMDPNNAAAIARRGQDPDDYELYRVDRGSIHGPTLVAARVLRVPGGGRPASFNAEGGRVGILRKHKGFDRGGIAIELYDLP